MTRSTDDKIMIVVGIAIFLSLIFSAVMPMFRPPKETKITFEVTGIKEAENATTLVQVQFECIKYCTGRLAGNDYAMSSCYNQCAKLGGCENGKSN